MILHGKRTCSSCPFRRERTGSFPVDALERSIGENLRGETYVHKCHSALGKPVELLCVGFIRFCEEQHVANANLQLGQRLGVIDVKAIVDASPIHTDWSELLRDHDQGEAG